ncbi:hypothetical protein JCM10908_001393 [Rhodotorula pacifica]|uniref:ssDNA-dependent ATPase MGS1 n=1 Tax=Rhodotorula pacifica TaxID=1495444 RepID=UPI00316DB536
MATLVECPICGRLVTQQVVNIHLDFGCRSSGVASTSSASSSNTPNKRGRDAVDMQYDGEKPQPEPPKSANGKGSVATGPAKKPRVKATSKSFLEAAKPLPEMVRPSSLDDFVGQEHLLGKGALLRGLIDADKIGSCIFWGPPGTGKTTIARVIAKTTSSVFKELSATNATAAQLREVFTEAENVLKITGRKTLLFIDEIQRFSKGQQDAFLPVVESGTLSLIASTTENPSFRLNNALLSRCRVFVLNKLTKDDIFRILVRALRIQHEQETGETLPLPPPRPSSAVKIEATADSAVASTVRVEGDQGSDAAAPSLSSPPDPVFEHTGPIDPDLVRFLAAAADGDARVALSALDLAVSATRDSNGEISRDELKRSLRKAHLQYDRTGDHHFDTISALHKAVRGSDANAALYWLARMLEGGDDPLFVARRLVRMASEDIGLANPQALPQALSAYQATQLIGMPECDCILAQIVVMLAESPKSVRVYKAYNAAKALVRDSEAYPVPLHIRNAPTGLMKQLGYGRDYRYEPGYAHPVHQTFFPPELSGTAFLQDDNSVVGKTYDEAALHEWEWRNLGGKKWPGREEMMRQLEAAAKEEEEAGSTKAAQADPDTGR